MSDINKEFKKYKIPETTEKMEEYCLPKKFTLQPQQTLLSDLLSSHHAPWSNYNDIRGILLFHQIGAGKTCTAISIAEKFKKKLNVVVVVPAALISNFTTELRSECPGNEYITLEERKQMKKLELKRNIKLKQKMVINML